MSETYQSLRRAWREELLVSATYHHQPREFRVMKLGWTEERERCLAWQYGKGWRCFEVAELTEVSVGAVASELPKVDEIRKPPVCVQVVDKLEDESPEPG